jgi:pyruvate dehydrogenase E1 component alpha subunit
VQVHEVAAEAIARARRGDGPTLIEAQTYRFRGHSLADPDELRPKAEKEKWQVGGVKTANYPYIRPFKYPII